MHSNGIPQKSINLYVRVTDISYPKGNTQSLGVRLHHELPMEFRFCRHCCASFRHTFRIVIRPPGRHQLKL